MRRRGSAFVSTWISMCSPVATASPVVGRAIVWKRCTRFSSDPSTWVSTERGSSAATSRRYRTWVSTVYALWPRSRYAHRGRHGAGTRPSHSRRRRRSGPRSCGRCSRPTRDRRSSRRGAGVASGPGRVVAGAASVNSLASCAWSTAPAAYSRDRRACRRATRLSSRIRSSSRTERPPAWWSDCAASFSISSSVSSGTSVSFVHGHSSAGPNCSRK